MAGITAASLFSNSSLGGIAGGLGQLAGGLGFGSKKKRGPSHDDLIAFNNRQVRGTIHNTAGAAVEAGKNHGFNPAALLGIQPSGGTPSTYVNGGNSFDPASIGQGVDRALNSHRPALQQKIDEETLRGIQLNNDYIETQIAGSKLAVARTAAVPPVGTFSRPNDGGPQSGHLNDYLKSLKSDIVGIEDGIAPRHKVMTGQDGRSTRVLNTDVVGDNEILMIMDAITTTIPDLVRNSLKRHSNDAKRKFNKYFPRSKKSYGLIRK